MKLCRAHPWSRFEVTVMMDYNTLDVVQRIIIYYYYYYLIIISFFVKKL
jgi:hypothetical protein